MSTESVSRRRVLAGAGATAAAGAALVLSASPAGADDNGDKGGLSGSWLVERADSGSPPVETVVSFAGGSVFLSRDHNPPGPPGYGTWSGNGNKFVFTFLTSGGGGPQTFLATVTGKGKLTGKEISGTYTASATDGDGNDLGTNTGTFSGKRIKASG